MGISDLAGLVFIKVVARKGVRFAFRVFSLVAFFVPRKKGLVIFSQSRGRYSGNSRALFEYSILRSKNIFWLYENPDIVQRGLNNSSCRFVRKYSLKGILLSLRAEAVVISYSSGDFSFLWPLVRRARVLMLWHATGIKCAGVVDKKFTPEITSRFLLETQRYDALIASSEVDRYYTASYQGVDVRKVYVTGTPRCDVYLRNRETCLRGLNLKKFRILYAPTFRDWRLSNSLFFPFPDFSTASAFDFFKRNDNVAIDLRPHPSDRFSIDHGSRLSTEWPGNIRLVSIDVVDDIDGILHEYDAIITDYSSIYLEPLLADIPVIFINVDMGQYLESRGLAYDYDLVTPGPKVDCFRALVEAIEDAMNGAPHWRQHRAFVKNMFFKYADKKSCERVYQLMQSLCREIA